MIDRVIDGRWRIVKAIGRGGMGVVYEGQNVTIGKRVALKFIDADFAQDPEITGRFQREARAASAVESTHIVEVFDTGTTDDGRPYLVMELLRGESLRGRIRRLGRLSVDESSHIVGQTLRGLQRAHAAGVIHRDLKPDNLFVVQRDDDEIFIKILDFGISKVRRGAEGTGHGTLTRKGSVLGTPNYMAPEQAQGYADLDERADLFSVGAILFECLTGNPPHHEHSSYEAIIVAMCTRDAPDVRTLEPSVPAPLAEVTAAALARDRQDRFPSAEAFLNALLGAVPSAIPSRRTPFSLKHAAPRASSDPGQGVDPAPTKTSWTTRDSQAATEAAPRSRRRLVLLGLLSAGAAFVGTLVVLALRPKPAETMDALAPATSAVGGDRAAAPPPVVALRVGVPAGGSVFVDGKLMEDATARGPAFTRVRVRVEAPGYHSREEELVLDGRPFYPFDLVLLSTGGGAQTAGPTATRSTATKSGGPPSKDAKDTKEAKDAKTPKGLGLKLKDDP